MINGECRTNLDNCNCKVRVFASVPNKGDYVIVYKEGRSALLKVVSITHTEKNQEPYIIVELNR